MRYLILLLIAAPSFVQSQPTGTWYTFDQYDQKQKMVVAENIMITYSLGYTEDPADAEYEPRDTVKIVEWGEDVVAIAGKRNENEYSAAAMVMDEDGDVLRLTPLDAGYASVQEAMKAARDNEYKDLYPKVYFSEAYVEKLEAMPSLDDLTKEDMIAAIKELRKMEPRVKDFMMQADQRMKRMRFVIARTLLNDIFIDMGYNPYAYTEEWFFERFRDDPDIKALTEEVVHLRLD